MRVRARAGTNARLVTIVGLSARLVRRHTPGVASIRAAQVQHSLAVVATLAPDAQAHARVLARIDPHALTRVREASRVDWLPLAIDLELSAAVEAELGPGQDRERARLAVLESMRSPLLQPFVHGVQTIFSLEPAALLRQAPRAWQAVYRGAGQIRYAVGEGAERVLVFDGLPAEVVASPVYLEAIAGAFASVFTLCKVEGTAEVARVEVAQRRAELRFSWY